MMAEKNRSQWDAGRFLKTLTYFDVIPFISCLQRIFTRNINPKKENLDIKKRMGVILVAGATGGVGKRVVQHLIEQNYQVRALVRDIERGKKMLGDQVELFEADITLPETLTPALMEGIAAVVC